MSKTKEYYIRLRNEEIQAESEQDPYEHLTNKLTSKKQKYDNIKSKVGNIQK